MKETHRVNSDTQLQSALGAARAAFKAKGKIRIVIDDSEPRSLNQNDISHVWYEQMAREMLEDDAKGWKRYCKLHHGVPILRSEDKDFRKFYDDSLLYQSYENKLAAMDFVPVTSLMSKAQLTKYLEAVRTEFSGKGVWLEFPNG